jgi:hypothetical protein
MLSKPPIDSDVFAKELLPALVDKWQQKCFCSSPGFLKVLSFDFQQYRCMPAELLDSELLWNAIVGEHFQRLGEWAYVDGEQQCDFRCPQCGLELRTRSEQYSINMWPAKSRPTDARALADVGLYVIGFRSFQGFPFKLIRDFRLAESCEEFVASITGRR